MAPPSLGGNPTAAAVGAPIGAGLSSDSLGLSHLIRAYQVSGHLVSTLDPLGIHQFRGDAPPAELSFEHHGFKNEDMDRPLNLLGKSSGGHSGFLSFLDKKDSSLTLRVLLDKLKKTYTSNIGIEYMHIGNREQCNWIRDRVESDKFMDYSKAKKMHLHERLAFANKLEKFLGLKFTDKRFGIDGGENSIVGIKAMIDHGNALGIKSFSIGMPHRGRLNVLVNVLRKPLPQILKEFQGTHFDLDSYMDGTRWSAAGDVKYHLGTSMDRTYPDGREVHIAVLANPSHLEAVNPVVAGKVRAKQYLAGDTPQDKKQYCPVLMHGDAAIAGQGIVYETMQMSKVKDFDVGGTVHVVVNNQIGFTTGPRKGRSTPYCSDIGKAFNIPIFHANGDDPVAVTAAFELAVEWRQAWGTDVIVDVVCYRRFGHNEVDQPVYTQPVMYSKIHRHPDSLSIYEKRLIAENTATQEEIDAVHTMINTTFDNDWEAAKTWEAPAYDWLSSKWKGFLSPRQLSRIRPTGCNVEHLREIGTKLTTLPDDCKPNGQILKIYQQRLKSIETGEGIDWATAESLAFGTLLLEGNHVRLTGQDVQRGTFSHRHAVIRNQLTGRGYTPLNNLASKVCPTIPADKAEFSLEDVKNKAWEMEPDSQAHFTIQNSILSEFGVLGFEVGYSLENPNVLNLWEAQFGDFVNGAQIMIDQFISAGEDKWLRQSGITMLLPHGYMGQGAEHSSCRIERFLQQCDEDPDIVPNMEERDIRTQAQLYNWAVLNCTTPANYFHALRRQIHREFRKPLIIATPKNLLRDKNCTSTLADMSYETRFKRVYEEINPVVSSNGANVQRLIMCSGKLYYELADARDKLGMTDIAIVRIEQLAPFPWDHVASEGKNYPNATIIWCQEEPKNMGAWSYCEPRIAASLKQINDDSRRASYIGRTPSAATATGLGARAHNAEQAVLIAGALGLSVEDYKAKLAAL